MYVFCNSLWSIFYNAHSLFIYDFSESVKSMKIRSQIPYVHGKASNHWKLDPKGWHLKLIIQQFKMYYPYCTKICLECIDTLSLFLVAISEVYCYDLVPFGIVCTLGWTDYCSVLKRYCIYYALCFKYDLPSSKSASYTTVSGLLASFASSYAISVRSISYKCKKSIFVVMYIERLHNSLF